MVNILIYTESPFSFICGGLVVQYELCRIIDSLGFNIRMQAPEKIQNSIFSKYYNNEFDLNQTVVIYGETIEGNPLNAPHVVRWILAPIGIASESKLNTWNDSDLVYFFNSDKLFLNDESKIGKIYKTLSSVYINPIINNYNDPKRKGYCHTFRKFHYHKILKYAHPPKHSQEITRSHKFIDCIHIFNKRDIFISYDPLTFLNIIAAMCGCVSVVIKVDDMSEDDWIKTTVVYPYLQANKLNKLYGIAYGLSEIEWAKNTIHLVKQQWIDILEFLKSNSIIPFLRDIENMSYLENTVKNNFSL